MEGKARGLPTDPVCPRVSEADPNFPSQRDQQQHAASNHDVMICLSATLWPNEDDAKTVMGRDGTSHTFINDQLPLCSDTSDLSAHLPNTMVCAAYQSF